MRSLAPRVLAPLVLAATLLAGCSGDGLFRDRGYDYLRAEAGKPLQYPEGIRPLPAQELYPVPGVEARRQWVDGEKPEIEIPAPPRLVQPDDPAAASASSGTAPGKLAPERVVLTRDGNGYPVLMLDLGFDAAWQRVGDALRGIPGVKIDDLDRQRAVYFVVVDGKRTAAGDPFQLKLNYTANGIQVALQVDEDAMAAQDLSGPLVAQLREGLLK